MPTTRFRFWLWLIRFVGLIVPQRLRADWRQEWEAELQHREALLAQWDKLHWRGKLNLLWRSTSAFWDALWLLPKRWEDEMIQDIRFGVRMLLKQKSFTAVAALSLALGIGANTAIFSVLDALLLRSLPVKQPEQLVRVMRVTQGEEPTSFFSRAGFHALQQQNSVFAGMFSYMKTNLTMSEGGQAERISAEWVSGDFYSVLGVAPHLGRMMTDADEQSAVAVLSYNFWRQRFGADPQIIGKTIQLNTHSFTVIGVSPPGFHGVGVDDSPAVRIPVMNESVRITTDGAGGRVMARLKPGVSLAQAQGATDTLFQAIRESELGRNAESMRIQLQSARTGVSNLRNGYRQPLIVLMCLVAAVLLIACLNVANLLLARAATRRKEIAVRLAVGAGRFRLLRQLLTEGFLLSALGGAIGLLFARWGMDALRGFLPQDALLDIRLDGRMLGFTLVVTMLAGLIFGLIPAWQATRFDLIPALKNDATATTAGKPWELRRLLVILQVALSLVLVLTSGWFVRSLQNLRAVPHGYTTEQVLTAEIGAQRTISNQDKLADFFARLGERVKALPGVKSVTFAPLPFNEQGEKSQGIIPSTPQFFATFGIPLLRGREFDQRDTLGIPKVVIVSDGYARHFFGSENPLGKRIALGPLKDLEIVGVVGDSKWGTLRETVSRTVYYPHYDAPVLCVRVAGATDAVVAAIRQEVRNLDPNLAVFNVKTLDENRNDSIRRDRLIALLAGFFGLFALLLAALGLYGVMAYAVARRTREIGIRMALGAQGGNVLWLVQRETLLLAVIGIIVGLPVALAVARLTKGLLFGLTANDPITTALSALVMIAVAALAGYLPARRAARVDPLVALRHE